MIETRLLHYFLAVAREQNITRAAEALHVTQSTLSKQMMDLEQQLGKQLLIRGNRSVTLTEEGAFLRKQAQEIMELVEKTESEFSAAEETISGDVHIGGGETDAMRLIARAAHRLQSAYPHIAYHLFSGNADDVTERLDRGLVDFGVFIEPADLSKYDFIKLPVTDIWGVLMRKDCPLAARATIRPQDLLGLPLLASNQHLVKNEFSGWFGEGYEKLNIITTYNLLYNASIMVEEGLGYALSFDKLINVSGDSKLCFIPLDPPLVSEASVIWKKYQIFSKAAQKYMDELKKCFEEMN